MFKAEFRLPRTTGYQVAAAGSIEELVEKMTWAQKFSLPSFLITRILAWGKEDTSFRLLGPNFSIQRGPTRMMEYTSF